MTDPTRGPREERVSDEQLEYLLGYHSVQSNGYAIATTCALTELRTLRREHGGEAVWLSREDVETVRRKLQQIVCAHVDIQGGNDYTYCSDCGMEWDYRKRLMPSDGELAEDALKALLPPAPEEHAE